MMRRIRELKGGRLLLKGAMAIAVILGAAASLAAPASAADGDWWRYHRFGHEHRYWDHRYHDRGGVYVYSGPSYSYAPSPYYDPPPPPPTYYYAPPAPGFSFGLHFR